MSMKGKGNRQRGYSVVEERDVTIAKALMFVVKRAIQKGEVEEGEEGEYLVADPEGWISLANVVCPLRATHFTTRDTDHGAVSARAFSDFSPRRYPGGCPTSCCDCDQVTI
jgi:hypothetical protein